MQVPDQTYVNLPGFHGISAGVLRRKTKNEPGFSLPWHKKGSRLIETAFFFIHKHKNLVMLTHFLD